MVPAVAEVLRELPWADDFDCVVWDLQFEKHLFPEGPRSDVHEAFDYREA